VCVSGPAPPLGCRSIRVRVVSPYIVPHLLSIHQALQFPTLMDVQLHEEGRRYDASRLLPFEHTTI
jgi:hypothetical protein